MSQFSYYTVTAPVVTIFHTNKYALKMYTALAAYFYRNKPLSHFKSYLCVLRNESLEKNCTKLITVKVFFYELQKVLQAFFNYKRVLKKRVERN